jgi:hypothetical protein
VLATLSSDDSPSIAIDSTNLYGRGGNGVYSVPLGGGSVTTLAAGDGQWSTLEDITSDGTNVYWSVFGSGTALARVPVGGGAVTKVVAGTTVLGMAMGKDGYIYFGASTGLARVKPDGSGYAALSVHGGRMAASPYNGKIYIDDQNSIWRFDPSTLLTTEIVDFGGKYTSSGQIAVDKNNVYWSTNFWDIRQAPN